MGIFCSFFTRSCFNPAIVHKTRATTDEYSRGERARSLFLEQALTHVYCPIFHYTVLSKIKRGRTASWRHNSLPLPPPSSPCVCLAAYITFSSIRDLYTPLFCFHTRSGFTLFPYFPLPSSYFHFFLRVWKQKSGSKIYKSNVRNIRTLDSFFFFLFLLRQVNFIRFGRHFISVQYTLAEFSCGGRSFRSSVGLEVVHHQSLAG